MNVFVSYSFIDSEMYLLSLLLKKLREQGHIVETSDLYFENNDYNISKSDLFLGIVTNNSESINKVITDRKTANKHNVRSILLIEKGVNLNSDKIEHIRFDRSNPEGVIEKLFGASQASKNTPRKSNNQNDTIIGIGIIVVISALIALLSGKENKNN